MNSNTKSKTFLWSNIAIYIDCASKLNRASGSLIKLSTMNGRSLRIVLFPGYFCERNFIADQRYWFYLLQHCSMMDRRWLCFLCSQGKISMSAKINISLTDVFINLDKSMFHFNLLPIHSLFYKTDSCEELYMILKPLWKMQNPILFKTFFLLKDQKN